MILKEFIIKELKMNGMEVGFEKAKVVVEIVEVDHINIYNSKLRIGWSLQVDYIAVILESLYKHERAIDIDMITDQGKKLSGVGVVTALEENVLAEITGFGILKGYEGVE